MQHAKILVTATFSLRQHALEKTPLLFDTVIFDDASMINETDCLAALSHGANRAIFMGNDLINQNMFLLNQSTVNKTLFYRIENSLQLEPIVASNDTPPSPTKASPRKKGRTSATKKQAVETDVVKEAVVPKITFVDSSSSNE